MGQRDEGFGAVGDGFALEVGQTVFGNHVHDVRARGGDDVAWGKLEDNAALALAFLLVGGGQAKERLAPLGRVGPAHELELAAGAGEMPVAIGFGSCLALEVDLGGGVDRDDVVVLHDHVRHVGVVHRQAEHVVVAVEGVVECVRAEREGEHDLARIEALARAGDRAGLVKLDDPIGEHLGVDADVLDAAFLEERADGVGHGADADLEAGAIFDLGGDVAGDGLIYGGGGRTGEFARRGVVAVDDVIDLADVDGVGLAIDVGKGASHFHDHRSRTLDDGASPVVGGPEVEEAIGVHRAGFDGRDVDGLEEAPIVVGDLAEVERDGMADSGVVLGAVVAAEEPAHGAEMLAPGIGLQKGAGLEGEAGADLDIAEFAGARGEGPIEDVGLAKTEAVVEPHARADEPGGLRGRDLLRRGFGDPSLSWLLRDGPFSRVKR